MVEAQAFEFRGQKCEKVITHNNSPNAGGNTGCKKQHHTLTILISFVPIFFHLMVHKLVSHVMIETGLIFSKAAKKVV